MTKSDKAAPQTANQRQATKRAKRKADGFIEVITWVKTDTRDKLKAEADKQGITTGELLDNLMGTEADKWGCKLVLW